MKIAIILFAIFGLAVCSQDNYGWSQGKEYQYKTKLRLMTGIPTLKSQFSGLQAKFDLKVQVKDANTLVVKPSGVKLGQINDEIAEGWLSKNVDFKPMPEGKTDQLETPFLINIREGVVKSLVVDGDSHPEIVNMQKAIANMLQLDLQEKRRSDKPNGKLEQIVNQLTQGSAQQDGRVVYRTMEESIQGECETEYDISALPRFAVKENPDLIPTPEACPEGSRFFEVTTTTNFSDCNQRPVYNSLSPLGAQCPPGVARCGDYWNRAAQIIYIICGRDRSNYVIQRAIAKEVVIVAPFAYDTEELQGGASMNMTLDKVLSISQPIQSPKNPVQVQDLTYQYPAQKSSTSHSSWRQSSDEIESSTQNDEGYETESSRRHGSSHGKRHGKKSEKHSESYRENHPGRHRRSVHQSRSAMSQEEEEQDQSSERSGHANSRNPFGYKNQRNTLRPSYWAVNASGPLPKPSLEKAYYLPLLAYGARGSKVVDDREAMHQIQEQINKIAEELLEIPKDISAMNIPARIEKLSRFLGFLDLDQLKEVYSQVAAQADDDQSRSGSKGSESKGSESKLMVAQRHLMIDALAMSGSNPAIVFLMEKIESHKITGELAAQVVMTIPKYVKTPTKELLNRVFEMVRKVETSSKGISQLESAALLGFSTLVQHACIRPKTQHTKYATSLFGAFCRPDTAEISGKWVPYIANKLRSADTNYEQAVYVTALGEIGHESILRVLKPYVDGEIPTSNDARTKAVAALRHLALRDSYYRHHKEDVSIEVFKAYATLFSSQSEQYEVRIVALANLFLADAPFVYWQKIALRTWFEKDNQVHAAIYSSLSSLAESRDPDHYHMAKKAGQALKLAKPFNLGLPYTFNYMSGETVEGWNVAYFNQLLSIGSRSSLLPNKLYLRSYWQFGDFAFNPFEMSANISAMAQLFSEGLEKLQDDKDSKNSFPALNEIKRALNIQSRRDGPAEGSAYLKVLGESIRMLPIDSSLEHWLQSKAEHALNQLQSGLDINLQKAVKIAEVVVSTPTIVGIPMVFRYTKTIVASAVGKAKLSTVKSTKQNRFLDVVKGKLELDAVLSCQKLSTISFMDPFSNQVFQSGVDKHGTIQAPFEAEVLVDVKAQKAEISVQINSKKAQESEIQLVHFHLRSFTAIDKKYTIKPIVEKKDQLKSLHAEEHAHKIDAKFGQKSLGLEMRVQHTMECCRGDFASWVGKARHFTPMSAVYFFAESNNLAPRELKIMLNPQQSMTKQITASIHLGTARKVANNDRVNITFEAPQRTLMDDEEAAKKDAMQGTAKMQKSLKEAASGYAVTVAGQLEFSTTRSSGDSSRNSGSAADSRRLGASLTVTKGTFGLKEKFFMHLEQDPSVKDNHSAMDLYVEGEAHFPELPTYSYQQTMNKQIKADATAKIWYGKEGRQEGKPLVEVKVQLERSAEQAKFAQKSSEAEMCQQDNKQGLELSPSCKNATLQAATFDKATITIQYDRVSDAVLNATYMAEDLATAYLYPYMSQDRLHVKNQENEIKIQAKVRATSQDQDDYLDVWIQKPRSNLHFRGIPWSDEVETIYPINARQSIGSRMADYVLGGNDQNECTLEQSNIVTYDNATFEAELSSDKWTLLTKDCSGAYKFAVLAKEEGQDQKKIKILIGTLEIKISPEGKGKSDTPMVEVDGKVQDLKEKREIMVRGKSGHMVARISATSDGYVTVESPEQRFEVTTDGERIVIEASYTHKSNLCGLCGDFNGEQSADLQTPEKCVETPEDAQDFVESYEVGSESGSSRSHSDKSDRHHKNKRSSRRGSNKSGEDSNENQRRRHGDRQQSNNPVAGCVKEVDISVFEIANRLSGASGSSHHGSSGHGVRHGSSSGRSSESSADRSCTRNKHRVVSRQGEKCFSINMIAECRPGCSPTEMAPKTISFHCMPEGSLSNHLESKAESNQALPEMSGKTVDLTRKVFTPKSCSSSM